MTLKMLRATPLLPRFQGSVFCNFSRSAPKWCNLNTSARRARKVSSTCASMSRTAAEKNSRPRQLPCSTWRRLRWEPPVDQWSVRVGAEQQR